MTAQEIRSKFLDFFRTKKHHIVKSAPLITKDDPTLMFVNSGMAPFKELFLGNQTVVHPRIADTQKCLRVSGKHNDLEEVGVDTYHHTFFEMLGNWSFGDYFKEDAIAMAWELLIDVYQLDPARIYVTIFEGDAKENLEKDTEAENLWKKYLDPSHILLGNKKDNFWEMGETGPCGPCSEIHVDMRTEQERAQSPGAQWVNQDHPQVIEIWNLVFMQFERKADGSLIHLKARHIDTGMGFERLCMVLQNKTSTYDTDVFQSLIQKTEQLFSVKYQASSGANALKTDLAIRVLVDHIRTICFCIADGQLPSANGAGYVIRRILRRAVRYAYSFLGSRKPFLHELFKVLQTEMGVFFPELIQQNQFVTQVLIEEEQTFLHTLEKGIQQFQEYLVKNTEQKIISGGFAFELYDTFGFPIDLTLLLAKEQNKTINLTEFEQKLTEQKQRSRVASTIQTGDWVLVHPDLIEKSCFYISKKTETQIIQYRKIEQQGKILYQLVLEQTPFYPEGGGQVGDSGFLLSKKEKIPILSTKKENNQIIHIVEHLPSDLDAIFTAEIDENRRRKITANHSATHLLHEALRKILGTHVEQRGSLVNEQSLRFDFSHFSKLSSEELLKIEQEVNDKIHQNILKTEKTDLTLDQAKNEGAMALFGEKYADRVRMICFEDSKELCGGTHVNSTAELGAFKIIAESSVASGIRRIEALTGEGLWHYYQNQELRWKEVNALFKNPQDLVKNIKKNLEEQKNLQQQLELFYQEKIQALRLELIAGHQQDESFVSFVFVENFDGSRFKNLLVSLQKDYPKAIFVVLSTLEKNFYGAISMDKTYAQEQNCNANFWVQDCLKNFEAKGGGTAFYAHFTGENWNHSILDQVKKQVKNLEKLIVI